MYTVFARRKAKGRRTTTPEHLVRAVTTLTWTRITRHLVVVRVGAPGMREAQAARLTPPRMRYLKTFHRTRDRAGSCSLHIHLRLSQQLSHLRRSIHTDLVPHFLTCLAFVTGSTRHSHLIYFRLLPESLGSYPPSTQMRPSTWMNTGTSIGSPCGGRS